MQGSGRAGLARGRDHERQPRAARRFTLRAVGRGTPLRLSGNADKRGRTPPRRQLPVPHGRPRRFPAPPHIPVPRRLPRAAPLQLPLPAPPLHTRRSGAFPRSRSDPRGAPRPPDPRPQKFRGPPSAARPLPADPPRTAGLRGAQQVRAGRSPSSRSSNTGLLEEEALAPILFFHLPQWNIGPSGWHAPRAAPRRPAAPASGTNGPEPRSAAPRPAAARPHDSPAPPARGGCRSAAGRGGAGRGGCGREGREWRHAAPPAAAGGQRRSQVR